jgi:hypothetical protein
VSGTFGIIFSTSEKSYPVDRILGEVLVQGFGVSVSKIPRARKLGVDEKHHMIADEPDPGPCESCKEWCSK